MATLFARARDALAKIRKDQQPGTVLWGPAGMTSAGVAISEDGAMRFAAVHACVRVLSEDVAALPLYVYRRLSGGGKERATDHRCMRCCTIGLTRK